MQGLVLDGVRRVRFAHDLPDAALAAADDALVAVTRAGLCGSDLHPYEGREDVRFGVVPGHEVVGEVVAVGDDVRARAVGDRVIVPFTTSCGRCAACRRGLSSRCERGRLFGYGDPAGHEPPLHGGQAELLRVPLADGTLVPTPAGMDDDTALLLADNLPTGWFAVHRADIMAGAPAVVVGLGAVGLCAISAAVAAGADPVVGVDPVADRRERAAAIGAEAVAPGDVDRITGGLAIRSVVEAAGTARAQTLAFRLLAPGGTLSVIAVQTAQAFAFTPVEAYDANVTVRVGRAPVRSVLDRLLADVRAGDLAVPTDLVLTHPAMPLADGPATYRRFAAREDGIVKAAFAP